MNPKAEYDRLSLTLPPELNEWLHRFRMEIKKSGGFKLPRTLIVRAFIRAIKESRIAIDLKNIKDSEKKDIADKVSSTKIEDMLVERLIQAIKR